MRAREQDPPFPVTVADVGSHPSPSAGHNSLRPPRRACPNRGSPQNKPTSRAVSKGSAFPFLASCHRWPRPSMRKLAHAGPGSPSACQWRSAWSSTKFHLGKTGQAMPALAWPREKETLQEKSLRNVRQPSAQSPPLRKPDYRRNRLATRPPDCQSTRILGPQAKTTPTSLQLPAKISTAGEACWGCQAAKISRTWRLCCLLAGHDDLAMSIKHDVGGVLASDMCKGYPRDSVLFVREEIHAEAMQNVGPSKAEDMAQACISWNPAIPGDRALLERRSCVLSVGRCEPPVHSPCKSCLLARPTHASMTPPMSSMASPLCKAIKDLLLCWAACFCPSKYFGLAVCVCRALRMCFLWLSRVEQAACELYCCRTA